MNHLSIFYLIGAVLFLFLVIQKSGRVISNVNLALIVIPLSFKKKLITFNTFNHSEIITVFTLSIVAVI